MANRVILMSTAVNYIIYDCLQFKICFNYVYEIKICNRFIIRSLLCPGRDSPMNWHLVAKHPSTEKKTRN